MTQVHLHFEPGMEKAVREGRKVATSRRTCKARPGDTFDLDGAEYRVVDVFRCELSNIRDTLYRLEGCGSPEEFEQIWRRLHDDEFPEDTRVFVHVFARGTERGGQE